MAHLPLKRRAGAHQGSKTGHAGRLDLPSMHPLKKDKHVEKQVCRKLPQNLSFQDHVATLGDPSLDAGHQRKKLRRELASDLVHEGLCGPIMRTFTLQLDGEDWEWTYLCPVALLNKLCALQPRLGDLIQNTPSVACYMDEVKPGNVLRPDPARTVACFYWTLKNLPPWYHARQEGWFFFSCFPTKFLDKLQGGYSFLFGKMLEAFFHGEVWNFERGFPCQSSQGTFVFKAPFSTLLSDEKSIKEMWGLRGASGTKPCFRCVNVVGHMTAQQVAAANVGWLVHFRCADQSKFAPHTPASFQEMRDKLRLVRGNKKECQRLGQLYGLHYTPFSVLWHPTLGTKVCPIKNTMFDWMHVLVASGGVAQYEVNEFAKQIRDAGIPLSALDTFGKVVRVPKSRGNLPSKFWQDRVNMEANCHIKAFAGEVLVAVPSLNLFASSVLQPLGLLPDHCLCLQYLNDILDILTQQHRALKFIGELEEAIGKHAVLFRRLYDDCAKPKFHWLFHIPQNFVEFEANLSCFGPERKHRATKTVAAHVFNDHLCDHVALRLGHELLYEFEHKPNLVEPIFLKEPFRALPSGPKLLEFWRSDVMQVRTSKQLMCPAGQVSLGDVLFGEHLRSLVVPRAFLQACLMTGESIFLAQVSLHKWKAGSIFESVSEEHLLEWHDDLRPIIYSTKSCGSLQACLRPAEALRLAQGTLQ